MGSCSRRAAAGEPLRLIGYASPVGQKTVWSLGLLALAIGFAGMTEMALFNEAVFGPRYGETVTRASYTMSIWCGVAGMVAAGLLAIKLGAARTALVGLGLAVAGVLLAMVGARYLGSLVTPFGVGIFRPCPLGAAAAIVAEQRLGRLRFLALSAVAIACSAASDSAWILGRDVFELIDPHGRGVAVVVIALFLLGALCVLGSGRLNRRDAPAAPVIDAPYRAAPPVHQEPPVDPAPSPSALRGLVLLVLPVMLLVSVSYRVEVVYDARLTGGAASVLPVVRFLVGLGAAAYFIAAVRRADGWPPLSAWALALVVYGVGLFVARWAVDSAVDDLAPILTMLLAALSTPFLWAIGNSYAALAVPPRYATTALAAWFIGTSLLAWAITFFVPGAGRATLFLVASVMTVSVGFYLLRRGRDLHRSLFEAAAPPPPSSSAVGTRR
jgi:hypothetical protein